MSPVSKNVTPSRHSRASHETAETSGTEALTHVTEESGLTAPLSKQGARDRSEACGEALAKLLSGSEESS